MLNENVNEIFKRMLVGSSIACRDLGNEINFQNCPYCHDDKNDLTNKYKLYANMNKGTYFCQRCNSSGPIAKLGSDLFGIKIKDHSSNNDDKEVDDSKILFL